MIVVQLERAGEIIQIAIADHVYEVSIIHSHAGELTFTVDGVTHAVFLATEGPTRFLAIDGDTFELLQPAPHRARREQSHGEHNLIASMPGQVTKVLVNDGDRVQRGQPLLVLEAMKMELKITAPHHGRVAKVLVQPGQMAERGQVLIEMSREP